VALQKIIDHRQAKAEDLPLFSGQIERDKAIAQVSGHNERWMDLCLENSARYIKHHVDFTGEDIRFYCSKIVAIPSHPNAWGALIQTLIKKKLIRKTGEYRQMKSEDSHARSTPVYEANENRPGVLRYHPSESDVKRE
jgi:hypothetical protein